MNKEIKIGDKVKFKVEAYPELIGTVERIVKMDGPCNPTEDQSKWTIHVNVAGNHPRNSGIFQLGYNNIEVLND